MSAPPPAKKSAYGTAPTAETSFRRTWDRDEYAAKAAAREATEREERKARYEAKLAGRKYNPPRPSSKPEGKEGKEDGKAHPSSGERKPASGGSGAGAFLDARATRIDLTAQIGKTQILSGAAAAHTGKRGRGAGFYCEECDLTFKDNVQWVEHLNSRQHQVNAGLSGEVKRASLEEVRERLRWLRERREEEGRASVLELGERLRAREEEGEREREMRREKRREGRRRKREGAAGEGEVKLEEGEGEGEGEMEMARLMGFGGFGTTKV